jgi:hypothetical protein
MTIQLITLLPAECFSQIQFVWVESTISVKHHSHKTNNQANAKCIILKLVVHKPTVSTNKRSFWVINDPNSYIINKNANIILINHLNKGNYARLQM